METAHYYEDLESNISYTAPGTGLSFIHPKITNHNNILDITTAPSDAQGVYARTRSGSRQSHILSFSGVYYHL